MVSDFANLTDEEIKIFRSVLDIQIANRMIENVIGLIDVPLGIAVNFLVNEKDYLIPMAIEEPSVIAAISNSAKLARIRGGFKAFATEPLMIAQVQLINLKDPYSAKFEILMHKQEIINIANEQDPTLLSFGGGCKDIEIRILEGPKDTMVIVHLIVDVRDAMGANVVNTMAEAVAPYLEAVTGGKINLRILSNLAVYRLASAKAAFAREELGKDTIEKLINAYEFAEIDPFRAATHNKGIMNGIDAVILATSNDWRAVEAGAHAYAALKGYKSLTKWEVSQNGDFIGTIELPLAVGIIGGATSTNPKAKIVRKILNVSSAKEFSELLASVGLAQNFAAIKALATEGIQRGHMSLHARNIAIMAGAIGDEVEKVVNIMVKEKKVRVDVAKDILNNIRKKR
jgi:hydroxymethylglutaryl-CoA reductase